MGANKEYSREALLREFRSYVELRFKGKNRSFLIMMIDEATTRVEDGTVHHSLRLTELLASGHLSSVYTEKGDSDEDEGQRLKRLRRALESRIVGSKRHKGLNEKIRPWGKHRGWLIELLLAEDVDELPTVELSFQPNRDPESRRLWHVDGIAEDADMLRVALQRAKFSGSLSDLRRAHAIAGVIRKKIEACGGGTDHD